MMRQLPRFCVKIIMMSVVMFACIGVGQALQYTNSVTALRYQTVVEWVDKHPSHTVLANQFTAHCLASEPLLSEKRWHGVLSKNASARIYECGKKIGATRLAEQIRLVDTQLYSVAWPLSLLVADGRKTESSHLSL